MNETSREEYENIHVVEYPTRVMFEIYDPSSIIRNARGKAIAGKFIELTEKQAVETYEHLTLALTEANLI